MAVQKPVFSPFFLPKLLPSLTLNGRLKNWPIPVIIQLNFICREHMRHINKLSFVVHEDKCLGIFVYKSQLNCLLRSWFVKKCSKIMNCSVQYVGTMGDRVATHFIYSTSFDWKTYWGRTNKTFKAFLQTKLCYYDKHLSLCRLTTIIADNRSSASTEGHFRVTVRTTKHQPFKKQTLLLSSQSLIDSA